METINGKISGFIREAMDSNIICIESNHFRIMGITRSMSFFALTTLFAVECQSSSADDDTQHRAPMQISAGTPAGTCSVDIISNLLTPPIKVTFDFEQLLIKPWLDRWKGDRKWSAPRLDVEALESTKTTNRLDLTLRGNLHGHPELPYEAKVVVTASLHRVVFETEVLRLPAGVTATGLAPCLRHNGFSNENHPPFNVARKVFGFFKGRGLDWIADAKRQVAERQVNGEEGPWIQMFDVDQSNRPDRLNDTLVSPLVGWVDDERQYFVATAGADAFQAGCRWFPCLHSNVLAPMPQNGRRRFKNVVYVTPPDLKVLIGLFSEDFPEEDLSVFALSSEVLWPLSHPGRLLGNFEGTDLKAWRFTAGKLGPYQSKRTWRSGTTSNRVLSAEGVTEGKASALWQLPRHSNAATLSREVNLHAPDGQRFTHLAVDAVNRGKAAVEVEATLAVTGNPVVVRRRYKINHETNRRLLIHAPQLLKTGDALLSLTITPKNEPVHLVLDNLRGFIHQSGSK